MRAPLRIFLLAGLFLSCTVPTFAQEQLWKELQIKVSMLYRQGRYSEAAKVAEEALKVAEKTFGSDDPRVATSLNNLGFVYKVQARYIEAEPLFKRSLKIEEGARGKDHPNVADILTNYAKLLRNTKRQKAAEELETRAKLIHEKHLKRGRVLK